MTNKIRKAVTSVMSCVIALSMLTGCGGGGNAGGGSSATPTAQSSAAQTAAASSQASQSSAASVGIKATDYVLGFQKYLCAGDKEAAQAVKLESGLMEQIEEVRDKFNMDGILGGSLENNMAEMVDPETVKDFGNALQSVLARVKATATEESQSGDVTKVKVSADCIDFTSVFTGAIAGELENLTGDASEEDTKKAVDNMIHAMADALYNYDFPEERESATVELKKSGDSWIFVDADEAGSAIMGLILKADLK